MASTRATIKGVVMLWALVILFTPFTQVIADETEDRGDNLQLGEEAIRLYERGEYESAIDKFNLFLLSRPSNEDTIKLREKAGRDFLLKMLMQGGEPARIARAIMLYSEEAPIRQETDYKTIKKMVEMAARGTVYQRHEATTLLDAQVGALAIPEMLPYLSKNNEEKINIILAIRRMGKNATVALVEALHSPDDALRQQVAILLGYTRDIRALADLKRVIENPLEKEEVKRYAKIAIKQISGRPAVALPRAKELYYRKALAYYQDDPRYKPAFGFNWLYWRWQDNQLVAQPVMAFTYNEIMAEHACYNALQLDAGFKRVWTLLARVYYAQYVEMLAVQEAVSEKVIELPEGEMEKLQKEEDYAAKAKSIVAAAGPNLLYYALHFALREKRPEVTVKILEDIAIAGGGRGAIHAELLKALRHNDKRVRYAAAEALVKIQPARRFRSAGLVIRTLQDALQEWDARSVLIIESDDATRNQLAALVREMQLAVVSVATGAQGLVKAKTFPPEDLILISTELKDISTVYLVNSFREDYRTRDIPIVLVGTAETTDKQFQLFQKLAQFKGIIPKPVNNIAAKAKIEEVLKASKDIYKNKAQEIALRAVKALASVPVNSRVFELKEARDSLGNAVFGRDDEIRMMAVIALGNLADAESCEVLRKLVLDQKSSLQLRTKAAWALGRVYNNSQMEVPAEDYDMLFAILSEQPADETPETQKAFSALKQQILYLLGQANISPEKRRHIFASHRVHKTVPVVKREEEVVEEQPEEKAPEEVEEEPESTEESEWEQWEELGTEGETSDLDSTTVEEEYSDEDDADYEYEEYDYDEEY